MERFEELFVSQAPFLLRRLTSRLGNLHDAEDVLQETYIQGKRYFVPEMVRYPKAWLTKVADRECWRFIVGRPLEISIDDHPEIAVSSAEAETLNRVAVRSAIKSLPVRHRHVLWRAYWQSQSRSEISKATAVGEQTVKERVRYARRLLRSKIDDLNGWASPLSLRLRSALKAFDNPGLAGTIVALTLVVSPLPHSHRIEPAPVPSGQLPVVLAASGKPPSPLIERIPRRVIPVVVAPVGPSPYSIQLSRRLDLGEPDNGSVHGSIGPVTMDCSEQDDNSSVYVTACVMIASALKP